MIIGVFVLLTARTGLNDAAAALNMKE